jgi:beta-lactamase superfamily II metal-dependent hydrolase
MIVRPQKRLQENFMVRKAVKKSASKSTKSGAKKSAKAAKKSTKTAATDAPLRHFAEYPSTIVFAQPGGKGALEQLLWGDYVGVRGPTENGWVRVCTRHVKEGWVREKEIRKDRILEVIFVDIGQGDGALVVTPDDKHILIDAGQGDNFIRFLRWRYPKFATRRDFEAIVISHPDADHYAGFSDLFTDNSVNVFVGTIYHNGIVERAAEKKSDSLGPREKDGGITYLTDVVRDKKRLEALLDDSSTWKGKKYPTMLKKALDSKRVDDIRMLCEADKHLPEYGPGAKVSIEVLGPVIEPDSANRPRLRWFGDSSGTGPTKNGHSIVLRLKYGNVSVLLGGDLNIPSEKLLLGHHTGMSIPPTTEEERRLVIEAARNVFQVDIAKSCHHGSADFSELFLEAVNPIATVISSGDAEPHAHPRSDTLGTIGRFSRGARPLIFSTELSRSASEAIKNPNAVQEKFRKAQQKIETAKTADAKKKALEAFERLVKTIQRSIGTYGAVNVRTDGERVVIAYKIETATRKDKLWDIYMLEPEGGVLRFKSKHEEE